MRWLTQVDSTNRELQQLARRGCPIGTVLGADQQIVGHGRLGRAWISLGLDTLTFSVLVRPQVPQLRWHEMILVTGVAVVDALRQTGADLALKWPNDVVAFRSGAKCAGILSEKVITPQGAALVVGIGINVSASPELLDRPATSLTAAGGNAKRDDVLACVLLELKRWIDAWETDQDLREAYEQRCTTLGLTVQVATHDRTFVGTATGIDARGGLILEVDGRSLVVRLADVTHLRPQS